MILYLDVETYSSIDLHKNSVYCYTGPPDFTILLASFAFDNGPVVVCDLTCPEARLPDAFLRALTDPSVLKVAHNAMFERVCLSKHLGTTLAAESWRCTRVYASYLGLPGKLSALGETLNIRDKKLEEGEGLIPLFCKPVKGRRAAAEEHPEEWALFKLYNRRDVEALREIYLRLCCFPFPEKEWAAYALDQKINDRGVRVDAAFVQKAQLMGETVNRELMDKALAIGIQNPRSTVEMGKWLQGHGVHPEDLRRKSLQKLAGQSEGIVQQGLSLRLELAKSSLSKYSAILRGMNADGRLRGLFYHYGGHTGRWSCKYVQPQNLPQNHLQDLDAARDLVIAGDIQGIRERIGPPTAVLSELIRTAFIPAEGKVLIVADYSQIESRVLSWLASEEWRMEVFRENRDIYCESASNMFGVPVRKNGPNAELRVLGKTAELGLGYQGGVQAMVHMGALDKGIPMQKLEELVVKWRASNPRIVRLWKAFENLAKHAVVNRTAYQNGLFTFGYQHGALYITLPSGRSLWYQGARLEQNGRNIQITFDDYRDGKRKRTSIYGGRLTENIVQAVSRNILAHALRNLEDKGFPVVLHIHDEAVVEAESEDCLEQVIDAMESGPDWTEGLPLKAEGYCCRYYQKN